MKKIYHKPCFTLFILMIFTFVLDLGRVNAQIIVEKGKHASLEFTEKDTYTKRFGIRGFKHSISLEKTLKLVTDAGMTWTRLELHWDQIEPEKGKYEWQEFDKNLADILEKKLKVMITIRSYSKWGSKKAKLTTPKKKEWLEHKASALPDKDNIDSYRKFIEELVERYDGDDNFGTVSKPPEIKIREVIIKNPVKHWQIENEPGRDAEEGSGFWNGTAWELAELFMIASKEIKEADEEAKIFPAGFPVGGVLACKTRNCFLKIFLQELRNRKGDFDIFDIHNFDDVETVNEQVSIVKNILKQYGFEKKDIWITALDFNWRRLRLGISKDEYNRIRSIDLVKKYVKAFSNGVEIIIQWVLHDKPAAWPPKKVPEFTKFRGIVENDLTPKPVYYVLNRMVLKLDGFKMCTDISYKYPSKQVFQFIKESGNSVYIAWNTNTKEDTSKLDLIKGEVKVTDIFGKETIAKGDSIVLTTVPVYIEKIIDSKRVG